MESRRLKRVMVELEDISTLTLCGHDCSFCPSLREDAEQRCQGCNGQSGRPWWGECKVYRCAGDKGIHHCGLCNDFPCDLLAGHYDPDNPEGQRNAVVRMGVLAYRRQHGDRKALALLKKTRR